MKTQIKSGVVSDPRPIVEKKKDYLHETLYSGLDVVWTEKKKWNLPSERVQASSSSCVKQSAATAFEVLLKDVISAGTYRLRKNFPGEGMWLQDCADMDKNVGTVFELIMPSQNMTEGQMNSMVMPKAFNVKCTGYRTFGKKTIDAIAQAIQAYGQCILTFESNNNEWQITPRFNGQPMTFAHAICATDYGIRNGQKVIVCRDSAGSSRVRYITEDFINKRMTGALYYTGAVVTQIPNNFEAIVDFFIRLLKGLKTQ